MADSPKTDGNKTEVANYMATLRNPRKFSLEGIPEEIVSDGEVTTKEQDPDCPRIMITKEENARIRRLWRRSLIIKLLGKTVGYNLLLRRLEAMWRPENPMELIDLDQDYYLARFEAQRDYDFARFEGPWMIFDHYLIVQEWMLNFNPRSNKTEKILAWVRFPALPIEYFDEDILLRVGNSIGRAIKVDNTTSLTSRGKFARVCVELDVTKPLLAKFDIEESVYPIEYEGIHLVCFKCGIYAHRQDHCGQDTDSTRMTDQDRMEEDNDRDENMDGRYKLALIQKMSETNLPA